MLHYIATSNVVLALSLLFLAVGVAMMGVGSLVKRFDRYAKPGFAVTTVGSFLLVVYVFGWIGLLFNRAIYCG
jgi:hypothetical protein